MSGNSQEVDFGSAAKTFAGGLTVDLLSGFLKFSSKGTDVDGTLTAFAPVELHNEWAGTNIVIRGETAKLSIQPKATLAREAVVTVADGGKFDLAEGVAVKSAKLVVGGKPVPDGTYTAANLPEAISGEDRVRVGQFGLLVILR